MGAPVTVASAQILVTAVDGAGPALAKIGTVGAQNLAAAQLQAEALGNSLQRISVAASHLGSNELFLSGAASKGAKELTNQSDAAKKGAASLATQSAAATLLSKKFTELFNGTALLKKAFSVFTSFTIGSLILGAANLVSDLAAEMLGFGDAADEAAKSLDRFDTAAEGVASSLEDIRARRNISLLLPGVFGETELDLAKDRLSQIKALMVSLQQTAQSGDRTLSDAQKGAMGALGVSTGPLSSGVPLDTVLAVDRLGEAAVAQRELVDGLQDEKEAADSAARAQRDLAAARERALAGTKDLLRQLKDQAKLAKLPFEERETQALRSRALRLAKEADIAPGLQGNYANDVLNAHQQTVLADLDQELTKREQLLGLSREEIELLQLEQAMHGTSYDSSDVDLQAKIEAEKARLRRLQEAERFNATVSGVAQQLAQIPANAVFTGNLKRAFRDAMLGTAQVIFADAVTRPFTKAIEDALFKQAIDPMEAAAIPAEIALSGSLDAAAPAMWFLAAALSGSGGGVIPAANGAVWPGGFTPFASGGVVSSPTFGLVGEGPNTEAVIPMPDNKHVPVKFTGGGAGGGDIHVHVHMSPQVLDSKDFRAHINENANHVGDVIAEQIGGANRNLLGRVRRAASGRS